MNWGDREGFKSKRQYKFQLKIAFLIKKEIQYLKAEGVYKNFCFYEYLYNFIDKIKFHRELEFGIQ